MLPEQDKMLPALPDEGEQKLKKLPCVTSARQRQVLALGVASLPSDGITSGDDIKEIMGRSVKTPVWKPALNTAARPPPSNYCIFVYVLSGMLPAAL